MNSMLLKRNWVLLSVQWICLRACHKHPCDLMLLQARALAHLIRRCKYSLSGHDLLNASDIADFSLVPLNVRGDDPQ